ncbi:protein THEM6 [Aethina tumida]|uniref:protein THEM6 n=1 Tax=Aethina tumida TaxID=116153 RepID=UPI00214728DB|nr:protein THEM6 [Aethina tumida]
MSNVICYVILAIFAFYLLLFLLLELHYFTRIFLCFIWARICRKKIHILDETTVNGICLTTDIDTLLTHMNNARFLRELDFAKIDFYERTGLYNTIRSQGGSVAVGATTIRYRRFIKLFTRYKITSKVIYWDDKHVYMEHRFISKHDNFINAIAMCKIRLINCDSNAVMNELLSKSSGNVESPKKEKPTMPLCLEKWIESNDISSVILRSEMS